MVNSKREWNCSNCNYSHLTWEGTCRNCKEIGTLQEVALTPVQEKSRETDAARRLRRRAKDSERGIAKRMSSVDGPDPAFANIASSTGRIGHITGIRVDAVSKNYVTENKNRKMPTWAIDAWVLINQRAHDFSKHALLHIDPPNMPKDYTLNGLRIKLDTMAIITQTRHEELIRSEQALSYLIDRISDDNDSEEELQVVQSILAGKLQDS
jgi:hypothetical protein